jgi:hypothetical protein
LLAGPLFLLRSRLLFLFLMCARVDTLAVFLSWFVSVCVCVCVVHIDTGTAAEVYNPAPSVNGSPVGLALSFGLDAILSLPATTTTTTTLSLVSFSQFFFVCVSV